MLRFCTRCGAGNDEDARFCDACGKPFAPRRRAPVAPVRAAVRPVRYLAGVAVLALVCGTGYYLLAPQAPSESVFAAAIDRYAAAHPDAFQDKVCLGNFPYASSPALVPVFDERSNRWLSVLVKAGVYAAPDRVSSGLFSLRLRYRLTPVGQAAVKNGKLCLAAGIHVTQVDGFSAPEDIDGVKVSQARYRYEFRSPQAWLTPEIKAARDSGGEGDTGTSMLILKDRRWVVPEPGERERLSHAAEGRALAQLGSEDDEGVRGPFSWFKRLFGPSEPSEAEIWQALVRALPVLIVDKDRFSKVSCERLGDSPRYRCRIRLADSRDQVVLRRGDDGEWILLQ
ncbi:zinc ribbon domain-containing protein [Paludibacterium yongneupense]|uniref:zinc ribbon domain-containing protein n=1 Tax=Paludibacterium yongneupense TaxID=400061 RepID=UPI0004232E7F|nr:zinc ribbon domain-containing protein [Paludibacterium yongneupense]